MSFLKRLIPDFWDTNPDAGPHKSLFNYRRTWRQAIGLLTVVALVPLLIMTFMDYNVTRRSLKSENILRLTRVTSNTRRSVAYFLDERKSALEFIAQRESVRNLRNPERLKSILQGLKSSFGGFVDIGLIDGSGRQVAYIGPYELQGRDYGEQYWFTRTREKGAYISGVFLGYRDEPHLIVAVRCPETGPDGPYVIRATLDTARFNALLASLDLAHGGDVFITNHKGTLQTPSRWHGDVLTDLGLPMPEYSSKTTVLEAQEKDGTGVMVGYAFITDTPFVLMVVKITEQVMQPWETIRMELLWLLVVSIVVILLVIVGVATRMVSKIFIADQTRAKTLHHMEHTNRMASIGRLAAGVAHEINNPLAIINEKAGLIKDIFTFRDEYGKDERLVRNVDSILQSVHRCGTITKRLLSFARHIDVAMEQIHFKKLATEVIGFLHKEAEYRSISITMDIPDDLPDFTSDRGKLQQIFLNLVNNAFQAMNDGGSLTITAHKAGPNALQFTVSDDGCGIPENDRKRIFEPFFSTKKKRGGTGLGLSITYGLVQELDGTMTVASEVGKGTTFTITLPITPTTNKAEQA
ncbi:sensor histidine kinase [Pseudodesulfovibrio senegalensis]|jgi:signal transduction histidine kinase|uniref:histidine kinase n=1 Tax=Pseudodesulfovibrio senegalensis TaxID=1721087 RepID=A0A6N6N1E6_9BACT|nr:PAS domain-containing sensor histidine kinase [Pseudodesulfovibrio senegalensis]KAB1441340.1 two-component sensor histidine kinase [Pseudodesulfovibrio senegalensis]